MIEDLKRLAVRRALLARRLEMIAQGARLAYEDGSPVDMASEKTRLEDELARLDRKIALFGTPAGQA